MIEIFEHLLKLGQIAEFGGNGRVCTPKAEAFIYQFFSVRNTAAVCNDVGTKLGHLKCNLTADTAGSAGYQCPFTLTGLSRGSSSLANCLIPSPLML